MLKMGEVQQAVQVTDTPPELSTDRADRSLMIEPAFVENIPLNIRNPLQLISDAAGVTKGDDGLSGTNSTSESRYQYLSHQWCQGRDHRCIGGWRNQYNCVL